MIRKFKTFISLFLISLLSVIFIFIFILLFKPNFYVNFIDEKFVKDYSINYEDLKSTKNIFKPVLTAKNIKLVDGLNNEVLLIEDIKIGIDLIESIKKKFIHFSILEIKSFYAQEQSSNNAEYKNKFKGRKLYLADGNFSLASESYKFYLSGEKVFFELFNGLINALPYKKLRGYYDPIEKKIFFSSFHTLNATNIEEAKLFDLSSLKNNDINLRLYAKGFFNTKNNNLQTINKLEFYNSNFETVDEYKIQDINAVIFSDKNSSYFGSFTSLIPDQKIKGKIIFKAQKPLTIRTNLNVIMDNLIPENEYFYVTGEENFQTKIILGEKKVSLELNSDLQKTIIRSKIQNLQKGLGQNETTKIFIDDLSKNIYKVKSKKYDIFYDQDKGGGYFIYGDYFLDKAKKINNNNFDIYLDLQNFNINSLDLPSEDQSSFAINLLKARVKEFSFFDNNYNNQFLTVLFSKNSIKSIKLSSNSLNISVNFDKSGFIRTDVKNTNFNFYNSGINKLSLNQFNNLNTRFTAENIKTNMGDIKNLDLYFLKNLKITTIDNINIDSEFLKIKSQNSNEKAYMSYNNEKDIYKIKGIYKLTEKFKKILDFTNYDFSFLEADLNLQWQDIDELKNIEGNMKFLVKDITLDRNLPNSTLLRTLRILNLNSLLENVDNENRINSKGLKIQRAAGNLIFSENRALIKDSIDIETADSSMLWTGFATKNTSGAIQELNFDLSMRFKLSENIPWYAAIFGGIPALAGSFVLENMFDGTITEISTINFKITGDIDDPNILRLN